jgi:hypothetical protein
MKGGKDHMMRKGGKGGEEGRQKARRGGEGKRRKEHELQVKMPLPPLTPSRPPALPPSLPPSPTFPDVAHMGPQLLPVHIPGKVPHVDPVRLSGRIELVSIFERAHGRGPCLPILSQEDLTAWGREGGWEGGQEGGKTVSAGGEGGREGERARGRGEKEEGKKGEER